MNAQLECIHQIMIVLLEYITKFSSKFQYTHITCLEKWGSHSPLGTMPIFTCNGFTLVGNHEAFVYLGSNFCGGQIFVNFMESSKYSSYSQNLWHLAI